MTISMLVLSITASRLPLAAAFAGAALAGPDVLLLPLAVLIEMTDMADGFVARRTGVASNVGTVYDGMADLIARMTEFICLAAIGALGFIPVLVFLWREGIVITAQRVATERGEQARYGRIGGKLKGVTQGACIVWLAAVESVPSIADGVGRWPGDVLVWVACTVTVLSGIDYLFAHRAALGASIAPRGHARQLTERPHV
ncbi:MAG: CDP-diacylglycerol---glycerol-3-phosphate 3-phosphatidyltransferase [Thermoleophilaceae bacterium]|jgi:CDP-diacylglycerol--glycerol-3-phosphate 3-phosphatidyltransferase|nr:CDP-diacylglycerol---glycerol-3-phosphate 3-phosphatidyltransferase [Thermoleophilaceae bacterium]